MTNADLTVYPNAFVTLRNPTSASVGVTTNHVFVGDQRVASAMSGDGALAIVRRYWFHGDHLSSTNFVTDDRGQVREHDEYFPFGETWVEETARLETLGGSAVPYLFTGKEFDRETGLYYFGARYYDPRVALWVSADPILAEYMAGRPNGGVFTPSNLRLYAYSWNSPIRLRDPDGRTISVAGDREWMLDQLDALTDDTLNYDENGNVFISSSDTTTGHPARTALVRELLASEHSVVFVTGEESTTQAANDAAASGRGRDSEGRVGSDVTIHIGTGAERTPARAPDGQVHPQITPAPVKTAHEGVHALHMIRGQRLDGNTNHRFRDGGRTRTERIEREEAITTFGRPDRRGRPHQISETTIRREQQAQERPAYRNRGLREEPR